ncbi:uncharacterized protein C4orf54 homolog [Lampris incognitus]|uniref:uncharacterized protein C4orf54 homolog n=1 Tax=Lampris incognitus TaxID=2546036 RepID=UPI0024B4BBED|nr:uncharacterized protein C4orf54 homolog [Lampris incognitus]
MRTKGTSEQKAALAKGTGRLCQKAAPPEEAVDLDLRESKTDGVKSEYRRLSTEGDPNPSPENKADKTNGRLNAADISPARRKVVDEMNTEVIKIKDAKVERCVKEGTSVSFKPRSSVLPVLHDKLADCGTREEVDDGRCGAHCSVSQREEGASPTGEEELRYADECLSGKSESDDCEDDYEDDFEDDVTLVLSDDCGSCAADDESHYITTHEIQLSELSDHEGDNDTGVGSSTWDLENDNQAYSFVHYASFDGDGALGERGERGKGEQAAVGTRDAAKRSASPDGRSLSKTQRSGGNASGQIHVSIKTTARAINEPSNIQEKENIIYHAKRAGDVSRYIFRGADGKAEQLCDTAKCFIATPGRLHFGRKLTGKELAEYSSGTSSAVSELDDADKEVRNLTARAFKSLAYPYFDAINFSTSSESSASEHGLGINRWSTIVDLQYGKVNMSQGIDQSIMSHKNPSSSLEVAKKIDNKGYKDIALASLPPPTSKIFTLSGNPHSASTSTKKIELMGKFGQGRSGVITLTETLNFRCNMKSGLSGEEIRSKCAQSASGSRSTDKVTHTSQTGQRSGARNPACNAAEGMEDTHKKAIFASSIIKNVISKKMQFEQERKMERGEISEPHHNPSPCFAQPEREKSRKERATSREPSSLHGQSSKVSEDSSEYAIVCVDELGDIVDSDSGETKSDCQRRDFSTLASETNLESTNEAGIDTKKGALEAAKSMLLRSQNSAFRSWRDGELEFQKGHKDDHSTPESRVASCRDNLGEKNRDINSDNSKLTKMSHLFVPSIQLLSSDGDFPEQLPTINYSVDAPIDEEERGGGGRLKVGSNTLRVADSRPVATSKSPEIKINLRSVRDSRKEPVGTSKLRPPSNGCNTAQLLRPDDFRCQALAAALKGESSDKVPHFMVRDIRDNKGKLQTPIHQVRDVRKLVKSSYHFVSLDNDGKSYLGTADSHAEPKKQAPSRNPASISPIVIKCQSVNTNSTGKQAGNLSDLSKHGVKEDSLELDRSSPEGAKGGALLIKKPLEKKPFKEDSSKGDAGLRSETKTASWKQEKTADLADKTPESKLTNQVALEKLQAAVKTMEQLYIFDKKEWKRKGKPHPLTGSHVLSLIATEEQGGPEEEAGKIPSAMTTSPGTDNMFKKEERPTPKTFLSQEAESREERLGSRPLSGQSAGTTESKHIFNLGVFNQTAPSNTATDNKGKTPQPPSAMQTPYGGRGFIPHSPKLPVSLKISKTKQKGESKEKSTGEVERCSQNPLSASADSENYLTIPVKSLTNHSKPASASGATRVQQEHRQSPKRSSIIMDAQSPEMPAAAIFHSMPLTVPSGQPQVYCFSPTVTPAPTLEPFQATQRKMLLDPTTGNYYLVDTPFQPPTKRLFDPETGQYVDVPIPQPPMTPVPMPISPLALSPGAYGHTYMIYPSFMPSPPVIPARMLAQSQMSVQSDADSGGKMSSQRAEGIYMESPYYMATGKYPQVGSPVQQTVPTNRAPQGFSDTKQPVISITSQQGPRIIAPPSFDGTTMSFVVEHR